MTSDPVVSVTSPKPDLGEGLRLLEAATEGPWAFRDRCGMSDVWGANDSYVMDTMPGENEADLPLIVWLRNNAESLIGALRVAEEALTEVAVEVRHGVASNPGRCCWCGWQPGHGPTGHALTCPVVVATKARAAIRGLVSFPEGERDA